VVGRPPPLTFLDTRTVKRGADWVDLINSPMFDTEVDRIRHSIARGRPLGGERWVRLTAETLGLEASLNPRGRPRNVVDDTARDSVARSQ